MSAPLPEPASRSSRTIGEILLARGFVTQAKLAEAVERQKETGKPLGQILVEDGAISRLELASALAEQWSDIGSVSPDFGTGVAPSSGDGTLIEIEELRRTRLALEERMLAFERSTDRPGEHALADRMQVLESALAEFLAADREGLARLHSTVAHLDQRVAASEPRLQDLAQRLDASVADLAEARSGVADVSGRLAELGAAVEKAFVELEQRSVDARDAVSELANNVESGPLAALTELTERVTAIEHRLFGLAAAESVTELALRVDGLSGANGAIETATRIDDLAHQVKELQARRSGDQHLVGLVEDLTAGMRELERRVSGEIGELEDRLADELRELERRPADGTELATRLEELVERVDALSSRPVADGESDARVAELTVRFDRFSASLDELSAQAEARADVEARLERLSRHVELLDARPATDPELESRLEELVSRMELDALASRIDTIAGTQREAASASLVDELRVRVEEVVGRAAQDNELEDRLEAIAARVEELDVRPMVDDEAAVRLDEIVSRLARMEAADEELRTALAEAESNAPEDGELGEQLAALENAAAAFGEELARAGEARLSERAAVESRLESLVARLEQVESMARAPAPFPAPVAPPPRRTPDVPANDDDVERLRMAVERLALDFADHRRAITAAMSSREVGGLLEELAARVDELQERAAGGVVLASSGDGEAAAGSHKELRALSRRLNELEEATRTSRDSVLERLERMMGTIDWRLQRLEHPTDG